MWPVATVLGSYWSQCQTPEENLSNLSHKALGWLHHILSHVKSDNPTHIFLSFRLTCAWHSESKDTVFCGVRVFVFTRTVSPNYVYLTFKMSRRLWVSNVKGFGVRQTWVNVLILSLVISNDPVCKITPLYPLCIHKVAIGGAYSWFI